MNDKHRPCRITKPVICRGFSMEAAGRRVYLIARPCRLFQVEAGKAVYENQPGYLWIAIIASFLWLLLFGKQNSLTGFFSHAEQNTGQDADDGDYNTNVPAEMPEAFCAKDHTYQKWRCRHA